MTKRILLLVIILSSILCINYRELSDVSVKEKVCSKADSKYKEQTKYNTLSDYITSLGIQQGSLQSSIQNVLLGGSLSQVKDSIKDLAQYLILIILGIFFLITYPFILCCFCGSCMCFNQNVKRGLCGIICYIITECFMVGIITCSVIGLASSGKFISYFNGSSCSLLNFFDHTVDGENSTTFPKWGGTEPIAQALEGTKGTLGIIDQKYDDAFDKADESSTFQKMTKSKDKVKTVMDNIILRYKDNITTHYSKNYTPTFIDDFTSYDGDTALGKIDTEYQSTIISSYTFLSNIKTPLSTIKTQTATLNQTLTSIATNFRSLGQLMDSASTTIAGNFVKLQNNVSDYIVIALKTIFGTFIGVASALSILLSVYVFLEVSVIKIFIHILWNIAFLMLFLGLIVGGVLGIVSEIGEQISPVMGYLLSPDYLASPGSLFGGNKDTADFVDTCLNRDGNLTYLMGGSDDNTQSLNTFYILAQQLETYQQAISTVYYSVRIQEVMTNLKSLYDKQLYDVECKLPNGTIITVSQMLDHINSIGTNNYCITKGSDTCTNITTDSGSSVCNSNIDCINYFTFIVELERDLEEFLYRGDSTINNTLLYLDISYVESLTDVKTQFTSTKVLTDSIITVLGPLLGKDSDFFSLFDCSFIRKDLIAFCDQFSNVFSSSSHTLYVACALTSLFSYLSIFFMVSSIYRSAPEPPSLFNRKVDLKLIAKTDYKNRDTVIRYLQGVPTTDSRTKM